MKVKRAICTVVMTTILIAGSAAASFAAGVPACGYEDCSLTNAHWHCSVYKDVHYDGDGHEYHGDCGNGSGIHHGHENGHNAGSGHGHSGRHRGGRH